MGKKSSKSKLRFAHDISKAKYALQPRSYVAHLINRMYGIVECCIYHKPRKFGESSDESDFDDGEPGNNKNKQVRTINACGAVQHAFVLLFVMRIL